MVSDTSTGQGYAYVDDGVALLAATDRRTAARLMWEAIASSDDLLIGHITPENSWAVDVGLAARLELRPGRLPGPAAPEAAEAVPPPRRPDVSGRLPSGALGAGPYDDPMTTVDLPLLPLGRGTDLTAERGVECPGDLPAPSDPTLVARATAAKAALGERLFVLGHHYQRDEVIQFADVTGDSFKLARDAAARPDAEFIVFCGVHFMAESADILTAPTQHVVLPDLAAGCSMADMARLAQVEDCWDALTDAGLAEQRRTGHLHELLRGHQGVLRSPRRRGLYVEQRRRGAGVGLRAEAGREGAVPPRPAPRPQHGGAQARDVAGRLRRVGPAPARRRRGARGSWRGPG